MNVDLTADQKAFVGHAIESGRIRAEEDAVREALVLWEQRERTRAELLAAIDEAEASVVCGEGQEMTEESTRELADRIKQRGRAAVASEASSIPR
jgi:putative addiction module CopG family antidote